MSSELLPAAARCAAKANTAAPYEERRLTDPRAMRALAHPVRIALLERLAHAGTLTATQASELLGESPANCAFHLRTLAKYGYVEEAGGGRGRERPWRRSHIALDIPVKQDTAEAAAASDALAEWLRQTFLGRAERNLSRQSSWPAEWREALGEIQSMGYLTLDEARKLKEELVTLLSRYYDRVDHPERRPAGAMPVEILALSYPLLHLTEVLAPAADDTSPRPIRNVR